MPTTTISVVAAMAIIVGLTQLSEHLDDSNSLQPNMKRLFIGLNKWEIERFRKMFTAKGWDGFYHLYLKQHKDIKRLRIFKATERYKYAEISAGYALKCYSDDIFGKPRFDKDPSENWKEPEETCE